MTPYDKNEVTFSITDGKISLDLGYEYATDEEGNSVMPETILAMVDSEGKWYCYGDCYQLSKPFNCEATVAPDDLKTEKWAMTWQDKGKFVNVGFRNDDVYIQGFDDNFPEAWIKGSKEGNAYRFKSGQYLGEIPYYVYLTFCASESDPNDETMLYMRDYTDFIFNENEHSLAPSPETVLIANAAADEYVSWYTYYESPMIRKQPDNINQTPLRPEFWGHVDCFEDYGYNNFSVYLYYFNNQYYLLDPANLYYEVKFDDDVVEFTKEEYYMTENITRVPFALTDGAISADGTYHIISYYKPAPEYISVQLFNVVDGETYASDIMTFDPARNMDVSGVNAPSEFHEVKKTEWFTLDGIRTDRPEKGIYIRVMTFSDGSRQTDKIVRR